MSVAAGESLTIERAQNGFIVTLQNGEKYVYTNETDLFNYLTACFA